MTEIPEGTEEHLCSHLPINEHILPAKAREAEINPKGQPNYYLTYPSCCNKLSYNTSFRKRGLSHDTTDH